jgi:hypothetical protein
MNVVVVGDAFLDRDLDGTVSRVAPDAPVPVVEAVTDRARPGGAALAAALAARDHGSATLIAAVATGVGRSRARRPRVTWTDAAEGPDQGRRARRRARRSRLRTGRDRRS